MTDHVHLVVTVPPKVAISELMGFLKGKMRVPEIMATTIPEILACLEEGQNGGIVARRAAESAFGASRTAGRSRERLC